MFSKAQKQEIAAKVEEILLSYCHPEMPKEKPCFKLEVNGSNPAASWADIEPNWTFNDTHKPRINPHNEMQAIYCLTPAGIPSKDGFRGDDTQLIESAKALLKRDEDGALVQHLGNEARSLLFALASRLYKRNEVARIQQ